MARLRPFSAGERLLAIDEGGTRGVIPLDILAIIQDMTGSELQIQDLFEIAFAISVGKLQISILGDVMLTIERGSHCLHSVPPWHAGFSRYQVFDALARKPFERPQTRTHFLKRLRLCLKNWYNDDHYDANALEDCLRDNLGGNDRMFEY